MIDKSTIVRIIRILAPPLSWVAPGIAARALERIFTTPMRSQRPRREVEWIADAARTSIPFDSERELVLYTWGDGPTVLLVHGWGGRGSQLGAFVEPLVRRGFRVVAFDAPAHGDAPGTRIALPELALAVGRVADHVGDVAAIVGHSLGAAATTMALGDGLETSRVVFIAPPERPANYLDQAATMLGFPEAIARRTQRRLERRFGVSFERARGSTLAPRMRAAMLAIHDEDDAEVPYAEGNAIVEQWPGAAMFTVSDLGHRRILRDAAVIDAVVGFVAGPNAVAVA